MCMWMAPPVRLRWGQIPPSTQPRSAAAVSARPPPTAQHALTRYGTERACRAVPGGLHSRMSNWSAGEARRCRVHRGAVRSQPEPTPPGRAPAENRRAPHWPVGQQVGQQVGQHPAGLLVSCPRCSSTWLVEESAGAYALIPAILAWTLLCEVDRDPLAWQWHGLARSEEA